MSLSGRSKRVLLYSHDSFGLGHVSRCRTIANAIVEADHTVSVLIVSGSPIIGSYEFRSGIDFVRIPGVVKQIDTGEYDSANLRVNVEHTLEMRTRIIRDTADIYRPDLFIVDKEPLGLRGEVGPALHLLKQRGTPLVLGLRDVMDDPAQLAKEWERKNVVPALRDLDLPALMSAFIWATYSLLTKRVAAFPTTAIGLFGLVSGVLSLLCHALLEPTVSLQARDWALLALLGLGPLGASFYLWDKALKLGDARHIGILSYLTPLASTALLIVVSGRPFSASIALATAMIIGAAVIGMRAR